MELEDLEMYVQIIGAVAGLFTLSVAIINILRSLTRPAGRLEGSRRPLNWPFIALGILMFFGAGVAFWKSLPVDLSNWVRMAALGLGSLLYYSGIVLYLWGMHTLRDMFGASSGFGVKLYADHRLVEHGPYAYVRHPMYLAVILSGLGGMLIYRTWSMTLFAVGMFGLVVRAKREEQILEKEFGSDWSAYKKRVPGWFPRFKKS
ncbi:MAG: hypothetical protein GTO14_15625 [Anaerolineales bacterium]|nr:hypothetical protein [Anaerolineales bacterium]